MPVFTGATVKKSLTPSGKLDDATVTSILAFSSKANGADQENQAMYDVPDNEPSDLIEESTYVDLERMDREDYEQNEDDDDDEDQDVMNCTNLDEKRERKFEEVPINT